MRSANYSSITAESIRAATYHAGNANIRLFRIPNWINNSMILFGLIFPWHRRP